jgi:hypothetical protein
LRDKARTTFERHAGQNNCEGMKNYFDHVLNAYPEIDTGMRRSGLKPLATVELEMDRLYQEHRNATRPTQS